MTDLIDYKKIQRIIENTIEYKVEELLEEKFDEKLAPLHNKIDQVIKISLDDRDELEVTKAKVANHTAQISAITTKLNLSI